MDSERHHPTAWDRFRAGTLSRRAMLRTLGATGAASVALTRAGGMRALAQGAATPPGTPALPPPPSPGPRSDGTNLWHVKVGAMNMDYGLDFHAFLPKEITINAGDAIWFEFQPMGAFHTVSFLSGQSAPPPIIPDMSTAATPAATPAAMAGPPTLIFNPVVAFPSGGTTYDGTGYLNSGLDVLMQPGQYFIVTFPKAGSYDYQCLVHSLVMHGQVTVQAKGAPLPYKQGDYDAKANDEVGALSAAGKDEMAKYAQATSTPLPDGTTLWDATVGAGGIMPARVQRLLPETLAIKVGDTVRWTSRVIGEPHTVTFVSGGKPPDVQIVQPQPSGPPKLIFNSAVVYPAGGPVYSGTGYFNSGLLGPGFSTFSSYQLTFVKPGEYVYFCQLHGSPTGGMRAKLTVSPRM